MIDIDEYSHCAPTVHPITVAAIASVESQGNPYAIFDNKLKIPFYPKTRGVAYQLASALLSYGHSIDIGVMQISSQHLKPMNLSLHNLFEPCYSISVGGKILTDNYYRYLKDSPSTEALRKAISAYNTGHPSRGSVYVSKVVAAAKIIAARQAAEGTPD